GVGSTFTLYLPVQYVAQAPQHRADGRSYVMRPTGLPEVVVSSSRLKPYVPVHADQDDDREAITPGEQSVLIIDDDPTYSRILLETAHERGLKAVVASRGDMGLAMARKFRPAGVVLDIGLPDTTGWSVLDQLQHDPDLRHVPIHMLTI